MNQTELHKKKLQNHLKIREERILSGLELVTKIHNIYTHRYQLFKRFSKDELDDMKQDCVVEMIYAVDRFDPSRNVKLSTYLNPRIQGFFKDELKKSSKLRMLQQTDLVDVSFDFVCKEIDEVLSLNKDQAYLRLDSLNLSNDNIQDILLDVSSDQNSYEIFDSLTLLPDIRIYIILSYYIMNKSIKELSKELGFNPDTGWIYRMKREGIKKLKELLVHKKILKEDTT